MGTNNSCYDNNVNEFLCTCGYTKKTTEGKKNHVWTWINDVHSFTGYNVCTNCNWSVTKDVHDCIKNDGTRISCTNLGKCSICNYNYLEPYHIRDGYIEPNSDLYCENCNTYLGHLNDVYIKGIQDGKYEYYTSVTLLPEAIFSYIFKYSGNSVVSVSNSMIKDNYTFINTQIGTYTSHSEIKSYARTDYNFTLNGVESLVSVHNSDEKADYISPTVIINSNEEITEWTNTKQIIISGTENYCTSVTVKIIDEEETTIYEGTAAVTNNQYSIICTPELEASIEGRIFTAIVTDNLENSTEQEFTIAKVDSTAPNSTSESKIGRDWSKTKNFTFKATDQGIGNVQIAFNDIKDLASAHLNENNEYEREYEFTGDVYSPKELSVLYKDELGNTTIQKITIDKLDNTAPSITNAGIHNNKLTVEANDIKEGIGEGSGVAKYRYIASAEKINNPEVSETAATVNVEDEFIIPNIAEVKYIYIVAEDLARKYK